MENNADIYEEMYNFLDELCRENCPYCGSKEMGRFPMIELDCNGCPLKQLLSRAKPENI